MRAGSYCVRTTAKIASFPYDKQRKLCANRVCIQSVIRKVRQFAAFTSGSQKSVGLTLQLGHSFVLALLVCYGSAVNSEKNGRKQPPAGSENAQDKVTLPEMAVTATPGRETGYRVPDAASATVYHETGEQRCGAISQRSDCRDSDRCGRSFKVDCLWLADPIRPTLGAEGFGALDPLTISALQWSRIVDAASEGINVYRLLEAPIDVYISIIARL